MALSTSIAALYAAPLMRLAGYYSAQVDPCNIPDHARLGQGAPVTALRSVLRLPAPVVGALLQCLQPRLQIFYKSGIGAIVDVLKFVGVILEIVELPVSAIVLDVLVRLCPHRLEGSWVAGAGFGHAAGPGLAFLAFARFIPTFTLICLVFALVCTPGALVRRQPLQEDGRAPGGVFSSQQRRQRASVGQELYAGQVRKRRGEVRIDNQPLCRRSGGHPWSPHKERHTSGLLVGAILCRLDAVLAPEPAVVGGEEDVGVLQLPGRLELLHERAHHLIHRQHRLQALAVVIVYVGSFFLRAGLSLSYRRGVVGGGLLVEGGRPGSLLLSEGSLVALRGSRGAVWGRRSYIGEERLVLRGRSPDEVSRFFGEDVGEEVLFLAAVGDYLAVLVDPVVVELLSVQLAVPLIPTGRDVGRITGWIAVEVLAEEGGLVATLLQACSDRILLQPLVAKLLEAPIGGLVALYAAGVGVEAGEDGGPRGAAQRLAGEGSLEGGALLGQQGAQVGHLLSGGVVQIVGENEDHVGPVGYLLCSRGRHERRRATGGEQGCQESQRGEQRRPRRSRSQERRFTPEPHPWQRSAQCAARLFSLRSRRELYRRFVQEFLLDTQRDRHQVFLSVPRSGKGC